VFFRRRPNFVNIRCNASYNLQAAEIPRSSKNPNIFIVDYASAKPMVDRQWLPLDGKAQAGHELSLEAKSDDVARVLLL
jgi:hypothetical protein